MWKSQPTYGWNWDDMALENQWTKISYAAKLPKIVDISLLGVETDQILENVETSTGDTEF
jgi:hypothetical protein